ncbi:MAG: hypothetical protein ABSH24_36690 [Bryobacteraceae bacterium]|jgi:hypothetical protein
MMLEKNGRKRNSMTRSTAFALAILLPVTAALLPAQTDSATDLYFLSAGVANVPARLYRVAAGAMAPELVRQVAPGVETVLADFDRRMLVVASPAITPHTFSVVDMSAPGSERSVSIGYNAAQTLPVEMYLLDMPGQGLSVALALGNLWDEKNPRPPRALTAIGIELPRAEVVILPLAALTNIRVSGYVGGGEALSSQQVPVVQGDPLHVYVFGPNLYATRIPRPPYSPDKAGPNPISHRLVVVQDTIDVIVADERQPINAIDVLDNTSHVWHRVALPFTVSRARAFGPWITGISAGPRSAKPLGHSVNVEELRALRQSPGKAKRVTEELSHYRATVFTVDDLFDVSQEYYPGDLVVLNGRTGALFTIHTGEGDSEVVLATDTSVYYRVNDALYRADLFSGKLGGPVTITQGPEVVQAHWAFLGPASQTR